MGELIVDFITSLDGYASAEGWPGWWGLEGPEYLGWLDEQPDAILLMGANTYRLMSGFAAGATPAGADGFSTHEEASINGLTGASKVVFSSTLEEPLSWANTTLVRDEAIAAVRAMKAGAPGLLRTIGSISLCRSLLRAGVVDRFRVVMFPVITGASGSERIYDGYPDVALDLIASRTFDRRSQLVEYRPRVLEPPPLIGPQPSGEAPERRKAHQRHRGGVEDDAGPWRHGQASQGGIGRRRPGGARSRTSDQTWAALLRQNFAEVRLTMLTSHVVLTTAAHVAEFEASTTAAQRLPSPQRPRADRDRRCACTFPVGRVGFGRLRKCPSYNSCVPITARPSLPSNVRTAATSPTRSPTGAMSTTSSLVSGTASYWPSRRRAFARVMCSSTRTALSLGASICTASSTAQPTSATGSHNGWPVAG